MKNHVIYYLFITLNIIINSCSEGFKDEPVKYSSSVWELVAKQVDSDGFTDGTNELFDSNARSTYLENENDSSSSTFMSIGNLTKSNYVSDGKYKFKLVWGGLEVDSDLSTKEIIWTQTSWPTDSTVQGFQEIGTSGYVDGSGTEFDGLMKSNSTRCVIDGNQGNYWFHCVGVIATWSGAMPGPKLKKASSMHLYIWTP